MHRAWEEVRVLAETIEADADCIAGEGGDIEAVDSDGAGSELEHMIERQDEGGLAATGAAADAESSA